MAKISVKNYLILGLIAIMLLLFMQFQSIANPNAIPIKKSEPCQGVGGLVPRNLHPGVQDSCACTLEIITTKGFPFKQDLYDYCQQNGGDIMSIVVLNTVVQLALTIGVVFIIYKAMSLPVSKK